MKKETPQIERRRKRYGEETTALRTTATPSRATVAMHRRSVALHVSRHRRSSYHSRRFACCSRCSAALHVVFVKKEQWTKRKRAQRDGGATPQRYGKKEGKRNF
ncbi:putative hyperparathyroidism-like protein [Sesbania bispinosa]|nr:putative hyperparathyroidism-like protein [Sesbania bispinosa]